MIPNASSILDHIIPMMIGESNTGKKIAFFKNRVPRIPESMIIAPIKPNRFKKTVVKPTKIRVCKKDSQNVLSLNISP